MLVSNIGRAIIKKLAVKFEGNEILSVDRRTLPGERIFCRVTFT